MTPGPSWRRIGGLAVHYTLGNQLARRGDDVSIVHLMLAADKQRDPRSLAGYGRNRARLACGRDVASPWFDFDPAVRVRFAPFLHRPFLPVADATILTSWQTSEAAGPSARTAGRLYQVVYDYEFWLMAQPELRRRIQRSLSRADVDHIATSRAVADMLTTMDSPVIGSVPCGIDLAHLRYLVALDSRPAVIGFALRPEAHKGMDDMLRAAAIVHRARPGVRWRCFGLAPGVAVPSWVEQLGAISDAKREEFYNSCAVFVLPSRAEGFGLPAAEAMACGAAVVTTANGGTADFAVDEATALVVATEDPRALAAAVLRLCDDVGLRSRLGSAGRARAGEMTWTKSTSALRELLEPTRCAGDL